MAGRIVNYATNEIILREGEKNTNMFVVLEGSVILYVNYRKADEYVLGARGKGKIFGEMSMFAEDESMYTAVAFTDCKIAWFQADNIEQFLVSYPKSASEIIRSIAKNNTLLRKNFSMLLEELSELKGVVVDKEKIRKQATKMSVLGVKDSEEV